MPQINAGTRIFYPVLISSGTFAGNAACAVSATGWGEFFIRLGVARDISALMEYRALPIQNAAMD